MPALARNWPNNPAQRQAILLLEQQISDLADELAEVETGTGTETGEAPVQSVDGQTGEVDLSDSYDPLGSALSAKNSANSYTDAAIGALNLGTMAARDEADYGPLATANTWTAAQRFPAGTSAEPSVRVGDEQSGLFRESATALGVTVAGVEALAASADIDSEGGWITQHLGTGKLCGIQVDDTDGELHLRANPSFFQGGQVRLHGPDSVTGSAVELRLGNELFAQVEGNTFSVFGSLEPANPASDVTNMSFGYVKAGTQVRSLGTGAASIQTAGGITMAGKITPATPLPASFADLAAVQTWLATAFN